jgi:hypothetical protein
MNRINFLKSEDYNIKKQILCTHRRKCFVFWLDVRRNILLYYLQVEGYSAVNFFEARSNFNEIVLLELFNQGIGLQVCINTSNFCHGATFFSFFQCSVFTSKVRHFQMQKYLMISPPHYLLSCRQLYIKLLELFNQVIGLQVCINTSNFCHGATFFCICQLPWILEHD